MITHREKLYSVYFGSRGTAFNPMPHRDNAHLSASDLLHESAFSAIDAQELYFLKQTHTTGGYVISSSNQFIPFSQTGDYLITDQSSCAIGVLTADCLPVIMYDRSNHAAGVAHAGWRGAVNGIMQKMYDHMHVVFGTQIQDLIVYCGPSAHACCYQVSDDFISHVGEYTESIIKKADKWFFDLPLYALRVLESMGISQDAINTDYASCTMCDLSMCSYRRDPDKCMRQYSVIVLR